MSKTVKVGNFEIGDKRIPPYMVAEIGGNFSDEETAIKLIDLAADCGVDAIKLQHYQAETLTSKSAIFDMPNTGVTSQFDLFKKYALGKSITNTIHQACARRNLTWFSTPSHRTDADYLESFDPPAYKVGSDDLTNIPFLRYLAQLGRPLIVSSGMCTLQEVEDAVNTITKEGNNQIVLLHCTTNYPTEPEAANLGAIQTMADHFDFPVGYSDHTIGINACYAAATLGADVLEFHFTYDKNADGPDHILSKNSAETSELIKRVRELRKLLGDGIKRPMPSESTNLKNNRKSLVTTQGIAAGEKLSQDNVDIKRPGYGISGRDYDSLMGKVLLKNVPTDHVLSREDLAEE